MWNLTCFKFECFEINFVSPCQPDVPDSSNAARLAPSPSMTLWHTKARVPVNLDLQ